MKTIVLADDNKHILEFCRQSLENEGYRVVTARDAAEAVVAVEREPVDLAILDVNMPAGGGLVAADRIKTVARIPVIFFTANSDAATADRWRRAAAAVIEKSDDLTGLLRAIESTLDRTCSRPARSVTPVESTGNHIDG